MILLILEITLIVYGIAALVSGKITLGSQRESRGAVARIAGFVFLLPLPLAFTGAFLVGLLLATLKGGVGPQEAFFWGSLIEWASFLGCGGLGMGIAFAGSVEADSGYRRRRRDGYDEVQVLDDEIDWVDEETPGRRRNVDVSHGTPTGLIAGLLVGTAFLLTAGAALAVWAIAFR
jgi:hypothetical protein